jgi:hypothetical protein
VAAPQHPPAAPPPPPPLTHAAPAERQFKRRYHGPHEPRVGMLITRPAEEYDDFPPRGISTPSLPRSGVALRPLTGFERMQIDMNIRTTMPPPRPPSDVERFKSELDPILTPLGFRP